MQERSDSPSPAVFIADGATMVARDPVATLQQIVGQAWYWSSGFYVPLTASFGGTLTNMHVTREGAKLLGLPVPQRASRGYRRHVRLAKARRKDCRYDR